MLSVFLGIAIAAPEEPSYSGIGVDNSPFDVHYEGDGHSHLKIGINSYGTKRTNCIYSKKTL